MDTETEVRVNFNLDRDVSKKLDALIPWGTRSLMLRRMTEIVVIFLTQHPSAFGVLINGHLELKMKPGVMEEIKGIGEDSG